MRFKDIRLRNFLSVGTAEYSYESQGLVLVEGHTHDRSCTRSNGAGKTSMFPNALVWCLTGETIDGRKANDVVNKRAGKDCAVRVRFYTNDGQRVSVTRFRSHTKHKNNVRFVVDGELRTSSSVAATNEEIAALLGVDRTTFLYTTVLGQGMTHRFSQLTDAGRKDVLDGIVGTQVYEEARRHARKVAGDLAGDIGEAEGRADAIEEHVANLSGQIKKAEERRKQSQEDRATRIAKFKRDAQYYAKQRDAKKKQYAEVSEDLKLWKGRHLKCVDSHERATTELHKVKIEINSLKKSKCSACGQPLKVDADALTEARERRDALLGEVGDIERRKERASERVTKLSAQCVRISDEQSNFDKQYDRCIGSATLLQEEQDRDDPTASLRRLKKETEESLDEARRKVALLEKKRNYYSFWDDGFAKIRAKVLEDVIERINVRLAHYCEILTGETIQAKVTSKTTLRSGEQRDKIGFEISTVGGSYKSASGGEQDRVDLAMVFALHDVAQEMSGFASNVLIVDEPCNFVDDKGIELVMRLMHEKLHATGTIFLTSQNPTMKQHVESIWCVHNHKGMSTLDQGTY